MKTETTFLIILLAFFAGITLKTGFADALIITSIILLLGLLMRTIVRYLDAKPI